MQTIILLFCMQSVYSFLSTLRINDAVGDSSLRYIISAAGSDIVKYSISATIAVQVVLHDQWIVILTTVCGGIIGNFLGHRFKKL